MTETLGIAPETELERRILDDPEWVRGASWGRRMKGHPEERVADHVAEVLRNVDELGADARTRERLRLIALTHDTFKHGVRWWLPGRTDHARLARRFAERHIEDAGVLLVVELHDDAYRAWRRAKRDGRWRRAEDRLREMARQLGDDLPLFLAFYRCDNATGSKAPDDRIWAEAVLERRP